MPVVNRVRILTCDDLINAVIGLIIFRVHMTSKQTRTQLLTMVFGMTVYVLPHPHNTESPHQVLPCVIPISINLVSYDSRVMK